MHSGRNATTSDTFRGDLFGGLTSAVVALPVALAFGVASGLGAAAGMYGVIAVGFFASVFGGTRSQISGPTAPMTVAMSVIVTTHASTLGEAFAIVVVAGLLQVALGTLRIGRFVVYTPHVVVSGFMSGIGIIIMLIQSLPFIGAPAPLGRCAGRDPGALVGGTAPVNFEALGDRRGHAGGYRPLAAAAVEGSPLRCWWRSWPAR